MGSPSGHIMAGVSRTNAGTLKIHCGFRPRLVMLWTGGTNSGYWQDSMSDGGMFKRVTAGTASSISSPNGVTPLADGFNLGPDADMNPASGSVQWIAFS